MSIGHAKPNRARIQRFAQESVANRGGFARAHFVAAPHSEAVRKVAQIMCVATHGTLLPRTLLFAEL
jgi:hypothetical protein